MMMPTNQWAELIEMRDGTMVMIRMAIFGRQKCYATYALDLGCDHEFVCGQYRRYYVLTANGREMKFSDSLF